jgi:hypothetical protein
MALTISPIREALKAQLNAVLSGRESDVKTYRVTGASVFPRITIEADPVDYIDYWVTGTSVGLATVRFVLVVEAGPVNAEGFADESARRRLDDFLSVGTGNNSSIIDAVMSDTTLGGVAETCHIPRAEVDDATATARLPIEVHVKKVGANV